MSVDRTSWSVLKYDLKTALDVLHVPCVVKVADDNPRDSLSSSRDSCGHGLPRDALVKVEAMLTLQYVRARVVPLADPEWYVRTRGLGFVEDHSRLVGTEILIPLDYSGELQFANRNTHRDYFTISEVVHDAPRYVHVMKDVVCASPGNQTPQIVKKGTVLEVDRVTKNAIVIRKRRDHYLICRDHENGRELAFLVSTAVHFSRVMDNNKYSLKEFVDRITLPQMVEFVYTSPYKVVTLDDKEAKILHAIFDTPLELIDLKITHDYIGLIQDIWSSTSECNCIIIPDDDEVLENLMVNMPTECLTDNSPFRADDFMNEHSELDIVVQQLYLRRAEADEILILRNKLPPSPTSFCSDVGRTTPPIPPRHYYLPLKPSKSTSHVSKLQDGGDGLGPRKRFHSDGDMQETEGNGHNSLPTPSREEKGIKRYFSQLSLRMKSTGPQALCRKISSPAKFISYEHSDHKRSHSLSSVLSHGNTDVQNCGFICYINHDAKLNKNSLFDQCRENQKHLKDIIVSNLKSIRRKSEEADAVYATIDWSKKREVDEKGCIPQCPVCRECTRIYRKQYIDLFLDPESVSTC